MRHLIWDMGGTLIDTYPQVITALCSALENPDGTCPIPHEISALTRVSIASAMATLSSRYQIPRQQLEEAYTELKRSWQDHPAPLMVGAQELLQAVCDTGGRNIVVTHRDRTSATALLRGHGLLPGEGGLISGLVCASDGFPRKPDPAMFLHALRKFHLDPTQTAAVGDRPIDAAAAQAAGLRAFQIPAHGPRFTAVAAWVSGSAGSVSADRE